MKLTTNIDKLGTAGLFLTAIFSPCCFPLFAFGASALGLGSFELFGGWTMWIFQAMVLISVGGLYISYRRHRCMYPLLVAVPSGLLIFYGYHFNDSDYWTYFFYAGMLGILVATFWNYKRNKMHGSCDTCTTYNSKTMEAFMISELKSDCSCCSSAEDENKIICYCSNVSKNEILNAIKNGAKTLDDIRKVTNACTISKCKEMNPNKRCCSGDILNILRNYK
jgi:hypothetical protein